MTLKHHTYALPLLAACLLTFYSCNSSSSEKGNADATYKIEVPKVKIKDQSVQLTIQDATQAQHLELPTGSFIDIPANAFVDANGNPVTGKVKLTFKEYHDAADIILAGIPMEYDTAGTKQVLQTAGMFKVEAFSGNDAIQIADGKSVQVSLISTDDGNPYNFYVFDEKAGNWVYTGKSEDKPLHHLKETASADSTSVPRAPIAPKAYNPNAAVIDMDIDVDEYPELASLRGLMWQYAGPDAEKDANANAWIFKHKWKKISVEVLDPEQSTFTLSFIDGKSTYKTVVTPVLTGKAFDKAMAKYNAEKAAYDKANELAIKEQQRGNTLYRVFGITRTGLYNCDRIWDSSTAAIVSATFITDDPEFGKKDSDKVYMVSGGMRTVYRVSKKDWGNLKFIKNDDKALVAVLSNGKFAVFSNEEFKQIGPNMIAGGKITFTLKTLTADEVDEETLRKMING